MVTDSQELLTVAEVADVLRVSSMTIYRLIQRDDLPAVRVGRSYRIRRADLDDYLASGGSDVTASHG